MSRHGKLLAVFAVLLVAVAVIPSAALGQDHLPGAEASAPEMMVDLLVLRPMGALATVVGTAVFVLSSPFSLAGGNDVTAFKRLMEAPAKFTFQRPLGVVEHKTGF